MNPFRRRFSRNSDGDYAVRIAEEERDLLEYLVPQLRDLLMATSPVGEIDPAARRLFPTAYNEDQKKDVIYQELMRDQLLAARLDALDVLEATTRVDRVTDDQLDSWMNCINQMRLVLGTRLDVSEEDEPTDMDPEDPNTAAMATYHYLGHLLGEILDARIR
ncbi:MAG: DUF2017 family protein [Actinomycetota bacterium]|jgi:hypothetical protein|nr:DUF2017 family protein [Actinomycetota bacterium]